MPFRPWHIHKLFWDESSEFCGLYILKGERRHCMVNIYLKQQVGEKNSLIKVQDQVEKKSLSKNACGPFYCYKDFVCVSISGNTMPK